MRHLDSVAQPELSIRKMMDTIHLARELKSIRRRATQFGYDLIDRRTGEVLLNPVS